MSAKELSSVYLLFDKNGPMVKIRVCFFCVKFAGPRSPARVFCFSNRDRIPNGPEAVFFSVTGVCCFSGPGDRGTVFTDTSVFSVFLEPVVWEMLFFLAEMF